MELNIALQNSCETASIDFFIILITITTFQHNSSKGFNFGHGKY